MWPTGFEIYENRNIVQKGWTLKEVAAIGYLQQMLLNDKFCRCSGKDVLDKEKDTY